MENVIEINNLTKSFGQTGIFDITINVKKGEIFGYLGPNGSGKSTTIRHILGFIKPQKGNVKVNGYDAWKDSWIINEKLGYIPGEIFMEESMTGIEFIRYIYNLKKLKNWEKVEELISYWEFNPKSKIKKMSKGMKQKVGLVCAFMHDPEIYILDEPTSGLDPLMQDKFISLIMSERDKGKTILLSSHIFNEIEKTCDRVAMIRNGRIISEFMMDDILFNKEKIFDVQFKNKDDIDKIKFKNANIIGKNEKWNSLIVHVNSDYINDFISDLNKYDIRYLKENVQTLEEYFMKFYKSEIGEMK